MIVSRRFKHFIVDNFLSKSLGNLVKQMEIIHETSVEVIETKKKALAEGDEALKRQIAQGRDIMSILCAYFPNYT